MNDYIARVEEAIAELIRAVSHPPITDSTLMDVLETCERLTAATLKAFDS